MAKFLTQEWWDTVIPKGSDMFSEGKTPSKLTLSLCEVYEDVPEDRIGEYVWTKYVLEKGVLKSAEWGTDEDDTPDADYVIYGDYDAYVKVLSGEVPLAKAAISGMFQIDGNMLKGMKMLGTYAKLMEIKQDGGATEW